MNKLIAPFFAAIVILTSTLLGIVAYKYMAASSSVGSSQMPAFKLPDLQGTWQSSDQWRGKVLVINFWATWCPPCRKEIPQFIATQNELLKQDVVIVGIALDEFQAVKNFSEDMAINYPILIANNGETSLARQFGDSMDAVPFTVIVNQEGQIIYRKPGEISKQELISQLTPLLKRSK